MAVDAVMLKTTTEPVRRSVPRAKPRAAEAVPAARLRVRRAKIDDRLGLIALAPKAGEIILDLGCGAGARFKQFLQARSRFVGIDSSLPALRSAHKKFSDSALVFNESWESLPFVNSHFDAVLCTLAGEHLEHMHAVLRELHRILKPGGRLVLALHYPERAASDKGHAKNRGVGDNLAEVDFEFRTGAFRHTVQDYMAAIKAVAFFDMRQHQTGAPGRQQSLFPEENLRAEQDDFPEVVVLQAVRPR